MRRAGACIGLAAITLALAPALASAQAIDARPGLWELTTVMHPVATPARPDASELAPEQRTQPRVPTDATSGTPLVARRCVTAESLQAWEHWARQAQEPSGCTYTLLEATPKRGRMTVRCERTATSGSIEWSVPTPERMEGRFDITSTRRGAEQRVRATLQSRWLGADCGDVAPE